MSLHTSEVAQTKKLSVPVWPIQTKLAAKPVWPSAGDSAVLQYCIYSLISSSVLYSAHYWCSETNKNKPRGNILVSSLSYIAALLLQPTPFHPTGEASVRRGFSSVKLKSAWGENQSIKLAKTKWKLHWQNMEINILNQSKIIKCKWLTWSNNNSHCSRG